MAISRIAHTRRGFLKCLAASAPVVVSARAWGGAGGGAVGWKLALSRVSQTQRAGNASTQTQIGGDQRQGKQK